MGIIKNFGLEIFSRYKWLIAVAIIVFLPGLLIMTLAPLQNLMTCSISKLCSSAETPWGAFTSFFIFDSGYNVIAFLLFIFFFAAITYDAERKSVIKLTKIAIIVIFASAILSNILYTLTFPNSQVEGSSTLIFAGLGLVLGLTVLNIFFNRPPKDRTHHFSHFLSYNRINTIRYYTNNTCIFVGLLVMILLYKANFFETLIPGVNSIVHGYSFFFAACGILLIGIIKKLRQKNKNR